MLADWAIKRRVPTLTVRRVANGVGLAGAGGCMIGICFIEDTEVKLVFLAAALGLGSMAGSGSASNLFDIAPSLAGHVTAFYNCVSNFAGIAVPPCTGYLRRTVGCASVSYLLQSCC